MTQDVAYLYKITNLVNGKLYIGVSNNPDNRKRQHFSSSSCRLVNTAVRKYGKDNFKFDVICSGTIDYIYDLEPKAIKLYNSDSTTGHGYNIASGGIKPTYEGRGPISGIKSNDVPIFASGFWFPNKRTCLKSLNMGVGAYNSRKKRGTLGDVKQPALKRSDDYPVFVSGFWFPNKRIALANSGINPNTFYKKKRLGTLADSSITKKSSVTGHGVYFRGFWFPNTVVAGESLNLASEYIRRRILLGRFEENTLVVGAYPERIWVVHGRKYFSMDEVEKATGLAYNTIRRKFYDKIEGYSYDFNI